MKVSDFTYIYFILIIYTYVVVVVVIIRQYRTFAWNQIKTYKRLKCR